MCSVRLRISEPAADHERRALRARLTGWTLRPLRLLLPRFGRIWILTDYSVTLANPTSSAAQP